MGTIKTHLIRIGNSQGIRIPKALLEQCHLQGELELETRDDCLIIRAVTQPRAGWEQAFQTMAENQDDQLLDGESTAADPWDRDEWEWS